MADEPKFKYGFSTGLFVTPKTGGESIVVGGVAEDASRWTRVLSKGAAQMLWSHLARLLYPEQSDKATAAVMTAPIRNAALPTVTTYMVVTKREGDNVGFEIVGWAGSIPVWRADLTVEEAQRFWSALDIALYPVGPQGSKTPNKPT
jgi:hypothetical protein